MNYYDEIRNKLINNEVNKKIKDYSRNRSDLDTYYKVGKLLCDAGKHYGEGIIKEYSRRLTKEFGKGYTSSSLKRFRQFYLLIEKGATLSHQLTWSHYSEMIPIFDIDIINYYVYICEYQNLSVRQLRDRIKSNEYWRLPIKTRNKLINNKENSIDDFVKDPILIKNSSNMEVVKEKMLQKLILEDIPLFLKELGNSFAFIKNEYVIKIGNTYNYIDLLLFNYEYNCFVVVELKVTELRKEYIGQVEVYMNYIDSNLKKIGMNNTIGIIIVKKNNKYVIEYCSDKRILSREYELV